MKISNLNGMNICILGFGKEGKAMLLAVERHAPAADVTIADANPKLIGCAKCKRQIGSGYLNDLNRFDVIIKSPGIPPQSEFDSLKHNMTSSTQIFLDSIAGSGSIVIGVTGSKGKSTTASLIHEILVAGKKNVSLIGNIGEPAISHLEEAGPGKVFVMEMSSYQLMDIATSPQIAVVTSFFPEHLDYHGTLDAYLEAKKRIARFQTEDDVIFHCAASDGARQIAMESPGARIPFSADDCPVAIEETHLIGNHNRSNIAAAFKVGVHLKIPHEVMLKAIRDFRGLPHRLQSLGVRHGVEWVDDAISTTPESTIAALDALGDRVTTIILGGQDRGNDFTGLARRIKNSSVKTVILFPGSGPRIRDALQSAGTAARMLETATMEEAVGTAQQLNMMDRSLTTPPVVLLSTASPSYNMFKNFEEKGNAFKACILGLQKST